VIARVLSARLPFYGRRVAVVDGDRSATYADVAERASRLAHALEAQGCRPGDRVALLAQNCLEYFDWFFACAAGGYIGLALNARLGTDALVEMLADAEPRAVIVDARTEDVAAELRARDALPRVEMGFGLGHASPLDYEVLLGAASGTIVLPDHPGDTPLVLTATSGTTGKVKMTLHTHLGVYTGLGCANSALRLQSRSRMLTALPMFFATATGGYWASIFAGAQVHLMPAFDAERFVDEVARSGITHTIVGPSPLYQVMDAGVDLAPLRRMSMIGAGGAPFDDDRFRTITIEIGPVVSKWYSMSEITFSSVLDPLDVLDEAGAFTDKVSTVGRPQPGGEIWVLDDEGLPVVPDGATVGEVFFRSPGISTSYWRDPEESAVTFVDGSVRSGDLATIDSDGFLRIVDRKKDLIVTGGINVAPREVEAVIATHPDVAMVAVIGVPHPTWGEAIHAVVVPRPGALRDAEAVQAYAAERLAPVKKPRSVEFVDTLPMNVTGKVLRRVLRDERR
jgi:acyl-CoA synthetase (AMP-forming)/AMP-acid ligase II